MNVLNNRVVRLLGKDETGRWLNLSLYQGAPAKKGMATLVRHHSLLRNNSTVQGFSRLLQAMAASANPILQSKEQRDPTLFCTAFKRSRFYMFTRSEPECVLHPFLAVSISFVIVFINSLYLRRDAKGNTDRDVLNERPTREEQTLAVHEGTHSGKGSKNSPFAHSAVIHTTVGDMHLKLFPQHAPKAVENFVGHARSGYFENVIFHRVIKKFVSVAPPTYR